MLYKSASLPLPLLSNYLSLSILMAICPGATELAGFAATRMMKVVVTIRATRRAKLQSNRPHKQTNPQLFTGRMPLCRPTNSVKALKGKYHTHLLLTRGSSNFVLDH